MDAEAMRLVKKDAQELAIIRVKLVEAVEELEHLRERTEAHEEIKRQAVENAVNRWGNVGAVFCFFTI